VSEPWLTKQALAAYFGCSVRSIETALADGCPHARIFGRPKFRPSVVEPWLEERGYLIRFDNGLTLNQSLSDANGAAPDCTGPAPDHEEASPHGS
jgi:hypothetical protein